VSGVVGRNADEGKEAREDDPHFKPLYVYTHKSFAIEYNRNQAR
jgi:transmembrane 9 superfamily protein 3